MVVFNCEIPKPMHYKRNVLLGFRKYRVCCVKIKNRPTLYCRASKWDVDVVVPVPDGSRPAAIQVCAELGLPYREGLVKNRYVGRTFIMPDQRTREVSVRRKLNAMPAVFRGKNVLLIDDSIVRGTTMSQIVDLVRNAGATKVNSTKERPFSCLTLSLCQCCPVMLSA